MRRFVLIFNHFEEVHLGKDVYLFLIIGNKNMGMK